MHHVAFNLSNAVFRQTVEPLDERGIKHAITALVSTRSTPIARAVAHDAITRLSVAWSRTETDRAELALGSLLAGWAVDRSGLGPHHALAQTAVRLSGLAHADVNAALLPHTSRLLREVRGGWSISAYARARMVRRSRRP